MKEALAKHAESNPPKRQTINIDIIESLEDLVSKNTKTIFNIMGLDPHFLTKPVEQWPLEETFMVAKNIANNLKVVNDISERGVKLITYYNKILTNDEEQKQYLLQVISTYRKSFPKKIKKPSLLLVSKK